MSWYRKNVLRYIVIFFQRIAIYCFYYIFSKIQLISQYLLSFLTLRNKIRIINMHIWRPFIRVKMLHACKFWTCNCFKTGDEWKMNSLLIRRKSRDILRYTFHIAIRYKFFVYCDIPIYRYIVTPLLVRRASLVKYHHQISQYSSSAL